jgi:hypothetical protein
MIIRPEETIPQQEVPVTSRLAKASFILAIIGIVAPLLFLLLTKVDSLLGNLEKLGIIGVVLLLLSLISVLTAIVLGIIALVTMKGKKGKGLAIAGIVMGGIAAPFICISVPVIIVALAIYKTYQVDKFDPSQYQGETGSIILPYKGESTLILRDAKSNKSKQFSTTDGVMKVPVGTFNLWQYSAIAKDGNNSEWRASCYLIQKQISVQSGSSEQFEVGPPFIASIDVKKKSGNQIEFAFKLIDRNNNNFTIDKDEPAFQVTSKSCDILWQGKFRRG